MFKTYNSLYHKYILSSFVATLQRRGTKESSEINVKNVLAVIKKMTKKNPLNVFAIALKNAKPFCEVKSLKISGINYSIPTEIKLERQKTLVLKWLILNASNRSDVTIKTSLAKEIVETYNYTSKTIKTCDDFHKIAESNKIFIQIRY